ncbi:MAG: hypothetical protein AAF252_11750 [Pseudomonadota bacterium]
MMRSVLSLFLCAVFVLTSHSAGAARASDRAVDHMVICIGTQTAVIYLGAYGAPVAMPHHCPDCALNGLDMNLSNIGRLGAAPVYTHHACVVRPFWHGARLMFHALPRAPPALI